MNGEHPKSEAPSSKTLVERLRTTMHHSAAYSTRDNEARLVALGSEAAKEIERLRAALERAKAQMEWELSWDAVMKIIKDALAGSSVETGARPHSAPTRKFPTRWRSVSKSMPVEGEHVLVWWPYWNTCAWVGTWNGHQWHSEHAASPDGEGPTHWMPLPDGPGSSEETSDVLPRGTPVTLLQPFTPGQPLDGWEIENIDPPRQRWYRLRHHNGALIDVLRESFTLKASTDPYKSVCHGGSGGKCTNPDCETCWPEKAAGCAEHGTEHFVEGVCLKCGSIPAVKVPAYRTTTFTSPFQAGDLPCDHCGWGVAQHHSTTLQCPVSQFAQNANTARTANGEHQKGCVDGDAPL